MAINKGGGMKQPLERSFLFANRGTALKSSSGKLFRKMVVDGETEHL